MTLGYDRSFCFLVSGVPSGFEVVGSDFSLGPFDLAVDHAMTDEQTMAEVQMMAEELMMVEEQMMAEEQMKVVDGEALEVHVVRSYPPSATMAVGSP